MSALRAEASLPAMFGDHMILRRDRPVPISGRATATVEFNGAPGGPATRDGAPSWRPPRL